MECKSKRKWCYLSRRILATSEFVSRHRAVFISIQRSYSSPIYILFLFNLAFAAFCFFFWQNRSIYASDLASISLPPTFSSSTHYNGACALSLPNEFKYEVNSIWFALLSRVARIIEDRIKWRFLLNYTS
jgi:hypothetical protein